MKGSDSLFPTSSGMTLKNVFIGELKEKYRILYDAILPIPYITDKIYGVDKVFVGCAIEYRDAVRQWKPLSSYNDILRKSPSQFRRRVLEGGPGFGKSTLTLKLVYDWCNDISTPPLKDVEIVILLRLRQLLGVHSIHRAIRQFILPQHSDLTEGDIKGILLGCTSLVILLDGYDEYPEKQTANTDIDLILRKFLFQEIDVIVTLRSSSQLKDYTAQTDRFRLIRFGEHARDEYIRKAVVSPNDGVEVIESIKSELRNNPVLFELSHVPLFFVIFAHMAYEMEQMEKFQSVTSFFQFMISCFHTHMRNKMKDTNVVVSRIPETEHTELDRLAFEALCGEKRTMVWEKEYIRDRLSKNFYDHYVSIGILIEEDVLYVDNMIFKDHIQYRTQVMFYHKLFCEWYAAHHLTNLIASDDIKTSDWLQDLHGESNIESSYSFIEEILRDLDPFDLQYVYRFSCGLNYKGSEKIIDYLQNRNEYVQFAILCTHKTFFG